MLHFDIDTDQLRSLQVAIGAQDKHVRQAFNRAMRRTAQTLRKMSSQGLRKELDLRNAAALRKRMKTLKIKQAGADGVTLWYGTNDMPVSAFKGRPRKVRSGGVAFRGSTFRDAFIAKNSKGKRTIFERKGDERLPIFEQTMPVQDQMNTYLEDEIFVHLEKVFFKHFERDLRARVRGFGSGRR